MYELANLIGQSEYLPVLQCRRLIIVVDDDLSDALNASSRVTSDAGMTSYFGRSCD